MRYYLDEYTNEQTLSHGLFKAKEVNHIKSRFFHGDKNYEGLAWNLLVFQMWYEKWMK